MIRRSANKVYFTVCQILTNRVIHFESREMATTKSCDKSSIALCQLSLANDKKKNMETCSDFIRKAAKGGASMIFFPEGCDYIANNRQEALDLSEPLDGPTLTSFKSLAAEFNIWISLGGIHEKVEMNRMANSHIILTNTGEIAGIYRKIHLFDSDFPGAQMKESESTVKGEIIPGPIKSPVGALGLCICYDLRFPEMGTMYKNLEADVLCYPSAFTLETGKLHWEILLRARAIETHLHVIAAAQTGMHNNSRTSWGHSMVVDPSGCVLVDMGKDVGIAFVNIDVSQTRRLDRQLPVHEHRRNDLYPPLFPFSKLVESLQKNIYQFGQTYVKSTSIFYLTNLTMAFTNIKCVVPGHVLVAPLRPAPRLQELTYQEICDLFQVVQKVQRAVEEEFNAFSSTVTIQDGPDAGQTINHVHVHILPRKAGDFKKNDDIYNALEHESQTRPLRTDLEMTAEANNLRNILSKKRLDEINV